MPRGKWTNHKGRSRKFTNPEELEEQRKREEQERRWKKNNRGDDESSSEEEKSATKGDKSNSEDESESDSESDEDSDDKKKGVAGLIQIENPNRRQLKAKKLATLNETLETAEPSQLSRREREELERQRKKIHYQKLQAEGKTEEARADLARLAIIKQQRAEAAKKRDDEKKEKELAKIQKSAEMQKALGKQ
ncbi:28 kDa heat- and acid-stable phosphoprotein-like isoform X1 [Sipha flava]|uniref:28 kDa heat- and acid-stable phosphoprotein-like isoform X1 n=1 Tax=Sipha flava TaxID=143950 RepID=A0A2S2QCX5_9HEMI|nr:28 kDa heat- and acid-stable phosphoprotein-like isoform X1 [Sipha flava]